MSHIWECACILICSAVACSGVPGDEAGYVVAMTDGEPSPAYTIQPGTNVRLISDYAGDVRRLGAPRFVCPCC
jgi:hypothetical protein